MFTDISLYLVLLRIAISFLDIIMQSRITVFLLMPQIVCIYCPFCPEHFFCSMLH